MLDAAGAGDRQHHGAAREQPGERDLAGCRGVRGCYVGERSARLGQLAGGQREPGDEADAVLLAVVDDFLGLAVGEVVEVLHGGHLEDLPGCFDVLDGDLG